MSKPPLLVLFFLLLSQTISAQEPFSVKGSVLDPTLGVPLENTVVTVLNSKDSTLVNFSRAKKDGSFSIDNLPLGEFILLASYPKYTDFVEKFSIDSTKTNVDMGKVNMLLISQLLDDVIITGKNAIVIKGDTIEYDASKFVIEPNSKVEDLLVQLPGIQVDKDGKITAQGETVNKVLVDGEEFFGDDPTLVTKNIRGDMVDKVQVYDKKSDQADFTGIDDGEKTKTINIQLKEDSKNGMFGKADAGIANDDLYQGQLMFNTFKGAQKLAAYGTVGNTGKIGLNWQDNEKYSSSGIEISGDNITFGGGGRDELESFSGQYNGRGIPLVHSGGAHYSTKWNEKKESINANYKIGALEVKGITDELINNNLPDGTIESNSHQDYNNYLFRQKLDSRYEIVFDSSSTLKVSLEGALRHSRSTNNFESSSRNEDDLLLNTSSRISSNEGDGKNFAASALWNKRLRKKGRTVSINLEQRVNKNDSEGFLNSNNEFYSEDAVLDSVVLIDQRKINNTENSTFNSNIAYTEPLSEFLTLAFNYRFNINNGKSNRLSYNQSSSGQYDLIDSLYSNLYDYDRITNQLGTTLNFRKKEDIVSLGLSASNVDFKQIDRFHDYTMKRSYIDLNPNARWEHKFSSQKSFRVSYNGNTNQPSLNQIQPVRENQDPLNQIIGNPDLDPSFRHSFSGYYRTYKVLTSQFFMFNMSTSFTSNAIVSNVNTNRVGESVYRYENLKNHRPTNYSAYLYYGGKIKGVELDVGGNLNYNGNSYFNMTNDELNKTQSENFSFSMDVRKYVQKKYSFYFSLGPSYTSSVSSLQKELSNKGWGVRGHAAFNVFLPGKFEIFSDANYTYTEATQVFADDFERLIWNGGLRKKFLKTDELILNLNVNDILNQNVGFSRSAFNNRDTQTSYTTIKRYFMLSLVWEFNKMGGKP